MNPSAVLRLTWMQKLLSLCGCGAFFAVAYFTHGMFEHRQVDCQLESTLHEIDQGSPGWRLTDLEAARAPVSDAENSAFDVDRAAKYLPREWPSGPADQRFLFAHSRRPDALNPVEKIGVQAELSLRIVALHEALALADKPRGRHPLILTEQPWTMPSLHGLRVSKVVHLLTLDALDRADDGDREGAARSCRAALNAARSLDDDSFGIESQLMRKNQAAIAARAVQVLLNHCVAEPETLADLQQCLEIEANHPGFFHAMLGHRAKVHAMLDAVETGKVAWDQIIPTPSDSALLNWCTAPGLDEVRHQHAALLHYLGREIEAAREPAPQRAARLKEMQSELNGSNFPLLESYARDIPAIESRFAAHDAHLRCTATAVAAERYRLAHGRWPASLEEMTPTFLKEVPTDSADGKPLRYRRTLDGVMISSRCLDDRSRQFNPDDFQSHYGVVVRLWDASLRRSNATVSGQERNP